VHIIAFLNKKLPVLLSRTVLDIPDIESGDALLKPISPGVVGCALFGVISSQAYISVA